MAIYDQKSTVELGTPVRQKIEAGRRPKRKSKKMPRRKLFSWHFAIHQMEKSNFLTVRI